MDIGTLCTIIILGIIALTGIVGLLVAFFRGEMKKFIEEKMTEAEKSGKSGTEKLQYVIDAFNTKYKIGAIILNCQKFVEQIITLSKNINAK